MTCWLIFNGQEMASQENLYSSLKNIICINSDFLNTSPLQRKLMVLVPIFETPNGYKILFCLAPSWTGRKYFLISMPIRQTREVFTNSFMSNGNSLLLYYVGNLNSFMCVLTLLHRHTF